MCVETVVQIDERDTYRAGVRPRSAAGWLSTKPLVVSTSEVLDVTDIERVQTLDA